MSRRARQSCRMGRCTHTRCVEFRYGLFSAKACLRFLAWLTRQPCPQCAATRVRDDLLESGYPEHSFVKVCEDALFDEHKCEERSKGLTVEKGIDL